MEATKCESETIGEKEKNKSVLLGAIVVKSQTIK